MGKECGLSLAEMVTPVVMLHHPGRGARGQRWGRCQSLTVLEGDFPAQRTSSTMGGHLPEPPGHPMLATPLRALGGKQIQSPTGK